MFEFLDMIGNYEQRVVKNDKTDKFTLDTARVTDRSWIYETAVKHEDFNNEDWIILEGADTEEEAIKIHERWLDILSKNVSELTDCFESITYHRQKGVSV